MNEQHGNTCRIARFEQVKLPAGCAHQTAANACKMSD